MTGATGVLVGVVGAVVFLLVAGDRVQRPVFRFVATVAAAVLAGAVADRVGSWQELLALAVTGVVLFALALATIAMALGPELRAELLRDERRRRRAAARPHPPT